MIFCFTIKILFYSSLFYSIFYSSLFYCILFHYNKNQTILYYILFYYINLYYNILYYIILYYNIISYYPIFKSIKLYFLLCFAALFDFLLFCIILYHFKMSFRGYGLIPYDILLYYIIENNILILHTYPCFARRVFSSICSKITVRFPAFPEPVFSIPAT